MENKRGSLSAKQLVTIILLIIGFAILLFIFYQINWTGQIDKEVCHQSVILRATSPMETQNFIPLKCRTSKICATSGIVGGKCEDDFENTKGITKAKVESVSQVEKLVAQEVVDCWTMMGEGKVSVFSQYWAERFGIGEVYPSCVICSRIAFDGNLDLELGEMDVLDYMKIHRIPDGNVSYYEYLTEEGGRISVDGSLEVPDIVEEGGELTVNPDGSDIIYFDDLEDTFVEEEKEEMAILFMQISAPTHQDSLLNVGKGVLGLGIAGGHFIGPSLTWKLVKAVGLKGGLYTLVAAIVGAGVQQVNVGYNRGVTSGYCGDISVGRDAREGCSVVRTIKYNEEEINKYCSVLESIS
jgi:hypothetical protein